MMMKTKLYCRSQRLRHVAKVRARAAMRMVILASLMLSFGMFLPGARAADEQVDSARAALAKWIETRRLIAEEKREWAIARETLNSRIDLVQAEIQKLRDEIDDAQESISDADAKREELIAENDRLKQASSSLSDLVVELETGTAALLKRLPPPILERVKPLSQRIPKAPNDTKLSLAERFQNIIGILNDVNKFNGEITVTSEVRTLPDGTSAEVTSLYIGIGQGYYVGANNTVAGVGTAGPDGWIWTPANEAALEIARAVAILQNEQVADFVRLPIEIQ